MNISLSNILFQTFRRVRVLFRRVIGSEPTIRIKKKIPLKYYGNGGYGGWFIPDGSLQADSIIVDAGLGEDISFSESIIFELGCMVHGFDPTPKSIAYVKDRTCTKKNFFLHALGIAGSNRDSIFFLPNNSNHVSGSISESPHLGEIQIAVKLIDFEALLRIIGADKIDLLKIDIEGAEYEFLDSDSFLRNAHRVKILCIEFHHRWSQFGASATKKAVSSLENAGFVCIWRNSETNEEFTFLNTASSIIS